MNDSEEPLVLQPFYEDTSGKEPRYYQSEAINRTMEWAQPATIVFSRHRTGTGKTYTTFQIIWRLWKAGAIKRASSFSQIAIFLSIRH